MPRANGNFMVVYISIQITVLSWVDGCLCNSRSNDRVVSMGVLYLGDSRCISNYFIDIFARRTVYSFISIHIDIYNQTAPYNYFGELICSVCTTRSNGVATFP